MDLISVIAPVFNNEQYISRCVNSILNQTYSNLEIILIDDGSTDTSPEICDAFYRLDKRVVVRHQENQGQSEARNEGIRMATGLYVAFVDSDDWLDTNALNDMYYAMKKYNVDVVQGGVVKDYDDHYEVYRSVQEPFLLNRHEAMKDICTYIINRESSVLMNGVWCKLYPKYFFDNCRFKPGRIWEDTQIQGKLIHQAAKIAVIPGIHYHYYQGRNDNISKIPSVKSDVDSWLSHKERYDEFFSMIEYKDLEKEFVLCCFDSIEKCWERAYHSSGNINEYMVEFKKMSTFVRKNHRYIRALGGVNVL